MKGFQNRERSYNAVGNTSMCFTILIPCKAACVGLEMDQIIDYFILIEIAHVSQQFRNSTSTVSESRISFTLYFETSKFSCLLIKAICYCLFQTFLPIHLTELLISAEMQDR